MKLLTIQHHLTDKQLLKHLNDAKGSDDFIRWQMLYLIQVAGLNNAEQIGTAVGVSKHTVYQLVRSYNKSGIEATAKKPKGGRRRSLLSIEQEMSLMEELKKMAQSGQIHSAGAIRKHVETKVDNKVSDDYLWDLFSRHGWKKKMPRPRHPKSDKATQTKFKKNFPGYWSPPESTMKKMEDQ
jgi:transposase